MHYDLDLGGMTIGQGHDTHLCHDNKCEILPRFNMAVRSYGTDTLFLVYMDRDVNLRGMTSGQGHDTSLDHGQHAFFGPNMAVRSYGPETDFWYVCTMTLIFFRFDRWSRL